MKYFEKTAIPIIIPPVPGESVEYRVNDLSKRGIKWAKENNTPKKFITNTADSTENTQHALNKYFQNNAKYKKVSKKIEAVNRLGRKTKGLKFFNKAISNRNSLYAAAAFPPYVPLYGNTVGYGYAVPAAAGAARTAVNSISYLLGKAGKVLKR